MSNVSKSLKPTTTVQEDITFAGQRRINMVWEFTQAIIAVGVIGITLYVDAKVAIDDIDIGPNQLAALMQLNVMSGLVIGFYFSRTNHSAIGSIGRKATDNQDYVGR